MAHIEGISCYKFSNGVEVVNTTPHVINFLDFHKVVTVPPSGVLINAKVVEKEIKGKVKGVTFVTSKFMPIDEDIKNISLIQRAFPKALIIGSIVACQAYKGIVVGVTACKGYERVPITEKRMSIIKFTIFLPEKKGE